MYGWIWRRLPFGLPGKLIGSVVLIAAAVAGLWYWIFPAIEPALPFDDVQINEAPAGQSPSTPTPAGR
jgi:hypothetical protein